jgi:hypothetical protein
MMDEQILVVEPYIYLPSKKPCKNAFVTSNCFIHQLEEIAIERTMRMVVGLTIGLKVFVTPQEFN